MFPPRRVRLLTGFVALFISGSAIAAPVLDVMRAEGCGCCEVWAKLMNAAGFATDIREFSQADLDSRKRELGLTAANSSCHTAIFEGYVIEGHVPAREIDRLLKERPDAIGLVVPGMPFGSPGMGEAGPDADPYDVLLLKRDGSHEVYASYR